MVFDIQKNATLIVYGFHILQVQKLLKCSANKMENQMSL